MPRGLDVYLGLVCLALFTSLACAQLPCLVGTNLAATCATQAASCDIGLLLTATGCTAASSQIQLAYTGTTSYTLVFQSTAAVYSVNISSAVAGALALDFISSLTITTDLVIGGVLRAELTPAGAVSVGGNVVVGPNATLTNLGTLTAAGTTTIQGALVVGLSSQQGRVNSNITLVSGGVGPLPSISGAGVLNGNVIVASSSTFGDLTQGQFYALRILKSLQVNSGASLQFAGNVTSSGGVVVNGYLNFVGTQTASTTSWLISDPVTISGTATALANLTGNGGISGNLTLSGNSTLAVGNSPGTFWVTGNLSLGPTSILQLDVASATSYDQYFITNSFNRAGTLYVNFENNFKPATNSTFVFATHGASSGSFAVTHGDYNDATYSAVMAYYSPTTTSFQYTGIGGSAMLVPSLLLVLLCVFAML